MRLSLLIILSFFGFSIHLLSQCIGCGPGGGGLGASGARLGLATAETGNIQFVYPIIAAGLVSSCAQQAAKDGDKDMPNILFIYSDDVGYGDVSVYGGGVPTPNIDRLAREGIMFTNSYTGPAIVPWGTGIETGFSADEQLYDINSDPGETVNIASEFPEVVAEMRKLLDEAIHKY